MTLRAPRRLTLLALVAPSLALLPTSGPASAARADSPAAAYAVDEWDDNGFSTLPEEPYRRVEVTYDATYGITLDGQVRTGLPWWKPEAQAQNLRAPSDFDRPIVDVTGGTQFGLALDDEGHLRTWGAAPAIPAEDLDETYRDVAAVGNAAIGVTTDGELRLWGDAASQYSFDPVALADADVVSVDLDGSAAVALTSDGRVLSAGGAITGEWNPDWDFPDERADETFVAIDAGYEFAVALTDEGEVVAWGVDHQVPDDDGGYTSAGDTTVPAFPEGRHAVAVSAGFWMAAAVLDDGSIVRWGTGERTQIPAQRPGFPAVDLDLDRYRVAVTYATVVSTTSPTASVPVVGTPTTVTAGEWSPTPDSLSYAWTVDGDERGDAASYAPAPADADKELSVTVTAHKAGHAPRSVTVPAGTVQRATFAAAPTATVAGKPRVGLPLTATVQDDPAATGTSYQWLRGSAPIAGATARTYKPVAADLGKRLAVRVTSTAPGYDAASATSAPTATVALGAARLKVAVPAKAKVGSKATIKVTGLAGGERFTVTVAGKKVTAKATAAGVGTVRVPVSGKPGSRPVSVVGSLPDRKGSATLRVVKG